METNAPKIICGMYKVSKAYAGKAVIKNISLSYFYGAKIGVLGLNGSGKSSLLRIMAGVDKDFDGEMNLTAGYSVAYLAQEPELDPEKTVKQEVESAVLEVSNLLNEFEAISQSFTESMDAEKMEKLLEKQSKIQDSLDHLQAWDLESRLQMAMETLNCPSPDTLIKNISGGEKRRVALCKILLQKSDILLLDEPTNHLDAETVAWLEHYLKNYRGTVIAVTHDRYFLDNVAGWILELDRGEGIPFKGNYTDWLKNKEQRIKLEKKGEIFRQKTLQHELEWINMTPAGRHTKSKARISAYNTLVENDAKLDLKDVEIYIPPGPRLGKKVLDVLELTKSFNDKLLFENLNFSLPAGAVLGIIGANGVGKSTFFNITAGVLNSDSGKIEFGESVKLTYIDQNKEKLDPEKTVWQEITGGNETLIFGKKNVNSRNYVAKFNFTGSEQQQKVSTLSGGAKNRVYLAKMLLSEANTLLLDEPTNDLDVNTLRSLEDAVNTFPGSALIISHDRWFLDRVVTHILAFEGNSEVYFFNGSYSEYEQDLKKRKGLTDLVPTRIKYRQLTR